MADTKFNINTNEYLPLRDVVFNTLRDAILTGKLVPGERLMENQLAEKLGVSRTPVREALRMLELENLVELVPRKGAQVLDMSEKDIVDILEKVHDRQCRCNKKSSESKKNGNKINYLLEKSTVQCYIPYALYCTAIDW